MLGMIQSKTLIFLYVKVKKKMQNILYSATCNT